MLPSFAVAGGTSTGSMMSGFRTHPRLRPTSYAAIATDVLAPARKKTASKLLRFEIPHALLCSLSHCYYRERSTWRVRDHGGPGPW
jgi:hypothetical protein